MESSTDSDFEEDETDGMENSRLYENIEKCLHENLDESGPLYENMEALTLENPSLRRRPTRRLCSSASSAASPLPTSSLKIRTEKKGSYRLVGRMQERLESLREAQVLKFQLNSNPTHTKKLVYATKLRYFITF